MRVYVPFDGRLSARFLDRKLFYNCGISRKEKRKNTAGAHLLSITETKKISVRQIAVGALLILNSYILGETI